MAGTIYALLVGINDYLGEVSSLAGCVNDVKKVLEFLRLRTQGGEYALKELVLTSGDRTNPREEKPARDRIIEGFRTHLARASAGDIACFYYSGHGSQEPVPSEFRHLEPDLLCETLVCYDSRMEHGLDLADKELAVLFSEVAARGAQLVTIFDSCHSGSVTRDPEARVRMTPASGRVRGVKDFLGFESILSAPAPATETGATRAWVEVPRGRHIMISACRAEELAQERFLDDGDIHGVLSYYLLDALERTSGTLSYRDLFARLSALVRNRVSGQNPTLEAPDAAELDRPFLGDAILPQPPYFSLTKDEKRGWVIGGGAVHGITGPRDGETTVLAYVPDGVDLNKVRRLEDTLGLARVTRVEPGESLVSLEPAAGAQPDTKAGYRAFVIALPLPPILVRLDGDEPGLAPLRAAIAQAGPAGGPSNIVREATSEDERASADLVLRAEAGRYLIRRAGDAYPLVVPVEQGYTEGVAGYAVDRLHRIVRWLQLDRLDNKTGSLPHDAVRLEFYDAKPDGTPGKLLEVRNGEIRFEYRKEGDAWVEPSFRVRLVNTTKRKLYATLLDMSEDFGIQCLDWLPGGGVWLMPGGTEGDAVWAAEGYVNYASVPERARVLGVTKFRDVLKLVVSTTETPGTLLEQKPLKIATREAPAVLLAPRSSLERLFQHLRTRDLGRRAPGPEEIADWTASQVTFTTVQPLDGVEVPSTGVSPAVAGVVSVHAHPALNATVRVSGIAEGARDAGSRPLLSLFDRHPALAAPFEFTRSRGGEPGASVVELEVRDQSYEAVTPEQPLRITVDGPLGTDEAVLPLAFDPDTRLFLPLGCGVARGGQTEITVAHLPAPSGTRDLAGSIKLFCQKVVAEKLKIGDAEVCRLAAAAVERGRPVGYEASPLVVREQVAAAQRILLYIHGLTGDTRGMAASAAGLPAGADVADPPPPLASRYDLILTYDYESLNTSIEETALKLREHLKEVGLGPGHHKTLHIVSHSLGTMVTRWFIERAGGKEMVQKVVLVAPPNAGTPWAKVEDAALVALAAGINGLASLIWPPAAIPALVGVLASAVGAVEKFDTTMDEIAPGSTFYKLLNASDDPCLPYGVMVGNTSKIPGMEAQGALIEKIAHKLSSQETRKLLGSLVFFGQPNDGSISVSSMMALPPGRKPAPEFVELPCDHVSYFYREDGLRALAGFLPPA